MHAYTTPPLFHTHMHAYTTPPLFALWQSQPQDWIKEEGSANGLITTYQTVPFNGYYYLCTYKHLYMHTCIHTNTHIHTCKNRNIQTQANTHTYTHTCKHTYTETVKHTHTHLQTFTKTRTPVHTNLPPQSMASGPKDQQAPSEKIRYRTLLAAHLKSGMHFTMTSNSKARPKRSL